MTAAAYPALNYADLPYPAACPAGTFPDGNQGAPTTLCVPNDYIVTASNDCPAGSTIQVGEFVCFATGSSDTILAPVPNAGLPPIHGRGLVGPSCEAGYTRLSPTSTTPGPVRCVPDAYVPRAGYSCPGGSQLATDPATLCFTPGKQTVVAPVRSS